MSYLDLDLAAGRVRVLGVDQFALHRTDVCGEHPLRRHDYGTVMVDLIGGHRPVDVLIGRDAEKFADGLLAHPGVQVI